MALSRYSVLPEQKIINTHVDQDLSLTDKVLSAKQGAYDQGEAFDLSNEGTFAKYAVRNVDIARRDQLHDEYVQKAKELVDTKYQGDYSQALPELRKLANGVAGNEFFSRATSALQRQKDMYETEKTIQKKGGSAIGFNRDAYNKAVYDPETGGYNDIDYDVQERLDYSKPKMDLMKDIAKDSRLTGISQSQIAGVLQHGSMKGVDGDKVLSVAKAMLRPYMDSPEGQQEMRYLTQVRGMSPDQALAGMVKSLAGIGSKQVGAEQDMDYMTDPGYLYRLKKADKKAQDERDLLEGPEGLTGMMTNGLNPNGANIDEKGNFYTTKSVTTMENVTDPATGQVTGTAPVTKLVKDYEGGKAQLEQLKKNYRKVHGEEIGDKELARLTKQAIDNNGEVAVRAVRVTPKVADATSKTILGVNYKKGDISNLQGSQIMIVSPTGKGGELITMDKMLEEFGVDGDKHKITSAQVTGRVPYNPKIPGAYRVTLTVDGKPRELIVSGSTQEQSWQAQYQPLVESAFAGKNGRVDIGGVHYKSLTAPGKDGKFHHQVRAYETLPSGEYVPMRERNKDGSIKRGKNGRPVYADPMSLDQFTNSMHSVFVQQNPDLYNVAGYTNSEEKDNVDFADE
jgi:hypothetical protein